MKLLVTGGNGLLGTELKKILSPAVIFTDRDDADITDFHQVDRMMKFYQPDAVLHLAAYTSVNSAQNNKNLCYEVNVIGTRNVAILSKHLIYMSTEYIFDGEKGNYTEDDYPNPLNFYSLTKLLGEYEAVQAEKCTIIRTLFKPRPYKHPQCPVDMWTSGGYVDEIAGEIKEALLRIDKLPGILHIGIERINLFELAKQTRPDVLPIERKDLSVRLPKDTSLNTKIWESIKHDTSPVSNYI
jgi:dTDP-4-dehydrorhamnose reductase